MLPAVAKIFTKILGKRIRRWACHYLIMTPFLTGFREGFSTMDNVFILDTLITKYCAKKRGRLYASFIDFRKAFDSIDRNVLWPKLARIGISHQMLRVLVAMYEDARFVVKMSTNNLSPSIALTKGVRQGCPLSPTLFTFFVNDFPDILMTEDLLFPSLSGRLIPCLLYADDLVLLSLIPKDLQTSLDILSQYSKLNRLEVNGAKSINMVFRKGTKSKRGEVWSYDGDKMLTGTSFQYLGVFFSMDGSWRKHFKYRLRKAKTATAMTRKIVSQAYDMSINHALSMLNALISSTASSLPYTT